jgi:HlyD family secretion protein
MKKVTVISLTLAAAALLGLSQIFRIRVDVEVSPIKKGTIREYVDEEATTRMAETYTVSMPYNGRVDAIKLEEGSEVKVGQVLAQIATIDLRLNLDAAESAVARAKASIRENDDTTVEVTWLNQAREFVRSMDRAVDAAAAREKASQARYDLAEKMITRVRNLASKKSATDEQLDRTLAEQLEADAEYRRDLLITRAVEALRAVAVLTPTAVEQQIQRKKLRGKVLSAELSEATARLRQAELALRRGTMVSPVDGVILERFVKDDTQLPAGTVLLRIGRRDDLEVQADLLSQDVVRIKVGDPVEIRGAVIGKTPARGAVRLIYPAAFTKVSSLGIEQQRVKVIVRLDYKYLRNLNEQRRIGAGYRVRARFITDERSNTLIVPRSALVRETDGNWSVYAVSGGQARSRPVALGLVNEEEAEIVSGLDASELVIPFPPPTLIDRTNVNIENTLRSREEASGL